MIHTLTYIKNSKQLLLFVNNLIIQQRFQMKRTIKRLYMNIINLPEQELSTIQLRILQLLLIYTIKLKIYGTGYLVSYESATNSVWFQFGQSHQLVYFVPKNIDLTVAIVGKKQKILCLRSSSKSILVRICMAIKQIQKSDRYHGKGVRFIRERIKLRIGKKKFN